MELELGRLDLRYEQLRTRSAARERRLLASLASMGQQTPIVVVRDGERDVVVDGYKRVRALRRLAHDTVIATTWDLGELDALVLERILRASEGASAIEEGWFLLELEKRFGLGREELARRFDRTPSWVSRVRGQRGVRVLRRRRVFRDRLRRVRHVQPEQLPVRSAPLLRRLVHRQPRGRVRPRVGRPERRLCARRVLLHGRRVHLFHGRLIALRIDG